MIVRVLDWFFFLLCMLWAIAGVAQMVGGVILLAFGNPVDGAGFILLGAIFTWFFGAVASILVEEL